MLLEALDLNISFMVQGKNVKVVRGVSYHVKEGELLGILGESGSGKTVISTCAIPALREENLVLNSGDIKLNGKASYIFQNATLALNPYKKIKDQLLDSKQYKKETLYNSLIEVGFNNPKDILNLYPHELSGGQCQKIIIAQALMQSPQLLIADEATSSVDQSVKYKILDLLREINKNHGTAIIFISHDFDAVAYLCHRLLIMYGGLIVEEGKLEEITKEPLHPYTKELYKCAKSFETSGENLYTMVGSPINPAEFREECPFLSRCSKSQEKCKTKIPDLIELDGGRKVRCVLYE